MELRTLYENNTSYKGWEIELWKRSQSSPVTILAHTSIASLTDDSASKAAK